MRRQNRLIAAVLFAIFAFPVVSFADFQLIDVIKEFGEKRFADTGPARIKAGPLNVHPTVRTKVEYDSNVFLEDQDAKQDIVYEVLPGIILDLPINKHRITVGYEADMEFFSKDRHRNQNDQNQNFFTLVNLHFPSWYVNVLERLSETSGRAGTTFTSRIPRIDQSIHPKIGYRWKRLIFETGFRHSVRDFRRQADDALDFQIVEWTNVVYYDLFARLKALVDYQIAQIDYDDNFRRNGTFHQARVGLEGELMPHLVVQMRIGPHFRNYEVGGENDFNSWVAELRADYDMREYLSFNFMASRKAVEATFQDVNYYVQHLVQFGVEYRLRYNWEIFSLMRMYRQNYEERTTVNLRTGYRRDDHFTLKNGIRYRPRDWLEFELAYQYARRDSNFSTFDFTDHRVSLSSALIY